MLYEGKPLNTTNLQVIEKPSENIIFDFDIQNISVSEKQVLLSIPVEKYNSNSRAVVHPSVLFLKKDGMDIVIGWGSILMLELTLKIQLYFAQMMA